MTLTGITAALIFVVGFVSSHPFYAPLYVPQEKIPVTYDKNYDVVPIREEIHLFGDDSETSLSDGEDAEPIVEKIIVQEPKLRVRRQVALDVNRDTHTGNTMVSAEANGNLWRNGPHRVNGNAHWSRVYTPQGAGHPTYGGGLTYTHSDRANVGVDVSRQRPFGTQVSAQAQGALWRSRNGRTSFDAGAQYSRSYGGRFGTSRPNYGGSLTLRHRF